MTADGLKDRKPHHRLGKIRRDAGRVEVFCRRGQLYIISFSSSYSFSIPQFPHYNRNYPKSGELLAYVADPVTTPPSHPPPYHYRDDDNDNHDGMAMTMMVI